MLLLLKSYTFTCLCVHTHSSRHTCSSQRTSDRSQFSPPCGFRGQNSGFRACPKLPYLLNNLSSPCSSFKCICLFPPSHMPLSRAAGKELALSALLVLGHKATTVSDPLPESLQILILSSDLFPFGLRTTIKAITPQYCQCSQLSS